MNIEGQQVLVTGGAGFIGSSVVEDLIDRNAGVDVVDTFFAGEAELVHDEATLHEADLRSQELQDVVTDVDPDVIVHLAAIHYIPYCNDNPEEAFEVNTMGTRNVLEAARDLTNLQRVVFASSAAVYPPREEPNEETSELGPMDVYGRTKLLGEDLLELFHEETGVPCAAARLFNVYGPNETNMHLVPAVLDQLRDGSREIELGNLTPRRDFVHVDDVTRALVAMVTEFDDGFRAYNVGTGETYSVKEVVECAGEALGTSIEIEQDEERVRESDRPHLEADISRIEAELGWHPRVEFVEGLRELLPEEDVTV